MTTLVMATGNQNKLREITEILEGTAIEVISMKDVLEDTDVVEDGQSFIENALIKARTIAARCGKMTLADDSGLVIDALNGEPGIYSARYMGEETSYAIKNQALLDRMADVPEEKRTARFVCAMACVMPDGREIRVEETFEGHIAHSVAGVNGFGYDPIFFLPEKGCTSAELSREEKNAISHRGKALRKMKELLAAL